MRILAYCIFLLLSIALVLFLLEPAPSLGKFWFDLHSGSLNLVQAVTQRYISPELWNSAIVPLLKQPPWYGFTVLAGLLAVPYCIIRLIRKS